MPSTKSQTTLRDSDPHNLPREWKSPLDDFLLYIFQLGVEIEQQEWEEDTDSSNHDDDDDDSDIEDDGTSKGATLSFPVLVSHVCARWRSVALNTPRIWTILTFRKHPRLAQAMEYISRSNGLPLTIKLNCVPEGGYKGLHEDKKNVLSLQELEQILDLLEPAISHWGNLSFRTILYKYAHLLMSKLHTFPAAPSLKSFQVHVYGIWTIKHKTRYLPFHGQAPNLKKAVFSGVQINWEGALPNFLRGLRELDLSNLKKAVWPTYATLAEVIKNSPELRTLSLRPCRPVPLAIPSLTELVLDLYASTDGAALVQHLDLPNLTHLSLGLSQNPEFIRALAEPVKGRDQSLLRQITHLAIWGLYDITSAEIFLSQLTSLKTLSLIDLGGSRVGAHNIYDILVSPWAKSIGPAPSSATSDPLVDSRVFCPKLEEISTKGLSGENMKVLVIARRNAGVPLKKVSMWILPGCDLSKDDELWITENVEELEIQRAKMCSCC